MTRRPKTPRTDFERKWIDFHTELHYDAPLGYRRQPKGQRAKSGQWWKRKPATLLDCLHRIVIDEAADPIPMDVLERCAPKLAGGTPSGRDTSRTDTSIVDALDKFRYGAATEGEDFR